MTYHKLVVQVFRHCYLVPEPLASPRLQHEIPRERLSRSRLQRSELDTRVRRVTCDASLNTPFISSRPRVTHRGQWTNGQTPVNKTLVLVLQYASLSQSRSRQ